MVHLGRVSRNPLARAAVERASGKRPKEAPDGLLKKGAFVIYLSETLVNYSVEILYRGVKRLEFCVLIWPRIWLAYRDLDVPPMGRASLQPVSYTHLTLPTICSV